MNITPDAPEFSHIVNIDELFSVEKSVEISLNASPDELKALAKRFSLDDLQSFSGTIRLNVIDSGDEGVVIMAKVNLDARLTQTCSVTIEPVADEISASFSQIFSTTLESEQGDEGDDDELAHMEGGITPDDEPPEPIINQTIDLGEFLAEELAVRINPFPRKKDVEFEWVSEGNTSSSPFAKLSELDIGKKGPKND